MFENVQKENAASTIQKVVRGHKARKETAPAIIEEVLTNRKMKEIKQNVKAAQISKQTLEDTAATTISSILRGHKGRKRHNIIKNYPQQALKRRLEVSNTQPSTNLQNVPRTSYLRNVNTKKSNIEEKYKKSFIRTYSVKY